MYRDCSCLSIGTQPSGQFCLFKIGTFAFVAAHTPPLITKAKEPDLNQLML
jgi:hypothetical protein